MRLAVVDREVTKRRRKLEKEGPAFMESVKPWSEPVNGARLLRQLYLTLQDHIVLQKNARTAVCLWIDSCTCA